MAIGATCSEQLFRALIQHLVVLSDFLMYDDIVPKALRRLADARREHNPVTHGVGAGVGTGGPDGFSKRYLSGF